MAIQSPIVLASGFFSQLFPGDTVPGTDTTAQASGNAALVLASTALASGNAGISTGLTALASGNAGLVSASNKVPISGGYMTGQLFAASGVVVSGTLSRNGFNVVTVGDVETVTSTMIASGTIIDADVNISGAINATKLRFLQDGGSAVARTVDSKLKDVVSVKDFGAVGDGTTDDTLALQAGLSYCQGTASGAILYIPAGTYNFNEGSQTPPWPSGFGLYSGQPITIIGAGVEKTILKNTSATGAGLRFAGGYSHISDFTIDNNNSTGIAFRQGGQHTNTKRLFLKNQTGGNFAFVVDGSTLAHLEDIVLTQCANGIALGQTNPTNYVTLDHVTIGGATGSGLFCNVGTNIRFNGLTIETDDVNYSNLAVFNNSFNITVLNFTMENSYTASLTADEYIKINDCKNINFLSFYANVHGNNNKPFFGVMGTSNSSTGAVLIENGLYKADNASTLVKTSNNVIQSLIVRNIHTTSASGTFVGVDNQINVTQESVENLVHYGTIPSHTLNASKLNCLNLLDDISIGLSDPLSQITLTNCTGTISGVGAARASSLGSRSIVRARLSANYSLAHNVSNRLIFDVEDYDTDIIYNTATGFATVKRAGYYDIKARISLAAGAGVDCAFIVSLFKSGVQFVDSSAFSAVLPASGGDVQVVLADVVYLDVGGYIEIRVYQYNYTSGTAKNVLAGATFSSTLLP